MEMDYEVRIESIAAGGAGVGRIEGKTVFVDGCVAGETVICRIVEDRRSWSRAKLLEIKEASPDRTRPACTYYGLCGGCNMQHLSYPAQLAAKTAILKDAFFRIGGINPPEPKVFPSSPWEYRNRMQFHCIKQSHDPQFGLKAKKSDEIVSVSDCPIADPGIRRFLKGEAEQPFHPPPGKDRFTVYARDGVFLGEGGIQRGKTRILDRELVVDTGVFFQSNGMMLEKLLTDLRGIAAGTGGMVRNLPMADLYCGMGIFAVFLGDLFPHADLVEENKTALGLAHENFLSLVSDDENAASNISADFFAQRVEDWIKKTNCHRYGFFVADPPRQGLASVVSRRLAAGGPPYFVYVSCDCATLARDSKILLEGGYKLEELRLYDFYPQTAHIETLAVFVR